MEGQTLVHQNYMHYLTLCWANHFSAIISPDIVFYTILCEIADEIKDNPEKYQHLFTHSSEKVTLMTFTFDVKKINLNDLIKSIYI